METPNKTAVNVQVDILVQAAQNFSHLINKEYVFTMGNNNKTQISLTFVACKEDEFTHIYGLDHLTDVTELNSLKNSSTKKAVYRKILNGDLTMQDLLHKSTKILEKLPKTYNPKTQDEYTIYERIICLQEIESILDRVKEGKSKLYKWEKRNCKVVCPNGEKRTLTINADYLLKIPGDNHTYYFAFLCLEKSVFEPGIRLKVISIFQDGVDVSIGQSRPKPILKIEKYFVSKKERILEEELFILPGYQKELEAKKGTLSEKTLLVK